MRNQQQTKWNNYDCAGKFATLQLSRIQSLAAIQPTFDAKGRTYSHNRVERIYRTDFRRCDRRSRRSKYSYKTRLNPVPTHTTYSFSRFLVTNSRREAAACPPKCTTSRIVSNAPESFSATGCSRKAVRRWIPKRSTSIQKSIEVR